MAAGRADEFDGEREEWPQYVERLKFFFKANGIEALQRYKFKQRMRKPGETVATFVAELRSIAEFCNFGVSYYAIRSCVG